MNESSLSQSVFDIAGYADIGLSLRFLPTNNCKQQQERKDRKISEIL
jgi:hypothetical protein